MGLGTPIDEDDASAGRRLRAAYAGRVVDEQGRRRLHGAWQGGFSAGYYNTVGSAEGWAPSAFRSSRGSRSEAPRHTAEAFMDDEDFEDANATLRAADAFSGRPTSATSADHATSADSRAGVRSANDTLTEVFSAAPKESAGLRLLRRMGWREGSGVGAKARARVARDAAEKKRRVLGPSLADLQPAVPSPVASFAPQQRSAGDERGLGFKGSPLVARGRSSGVEGPERLHMDGTTGRTPARFGVSAFEDGDDDIYAEPQREQYDRELGGPEPSPAGERSRRKGPCPWRQAPANGILPGFAAAATVPVSTQTFNAPIVPEGFEEKHVFETSLLQQPRLQARDAKERAAILGEQPLERPRPPVNVRPGQEELEGPKLERYQQYLRRELYTDERSLGAWQLQELEEFRARAAAFRAIPQSMRGRFTAASAKDKEVDAQARAEEAAGALLADLGSRFTSAAPAPPAPEPQLPWRESYDWAPGPLLCRRFKEQDPYLAGVPDLLRAGLAQARAWQGGHERDPTSGSGLGTRSAAEIAAAASARGHREEPTLAKAGAAEDAAQLPERPSMSIFRAVFAEDSDDSESDEEQ